MAVTTDPFDFLSDVGYASISGEEVREGRSKRLAASANWNTLPDVEGARDEVAQAVSDFLIDSESVHRKAKPGHLLVLRADMGVGKSRTMIHQIARRAKEDPNFRILIITQSHGIAKEHMKELDALGIASARYIGPQQPDPVASPDAEDDDIAVDSAEIPACRRLADLLAVQGAGGRLESLCGEGADMCPHCPHASNPRANWCYYRQQSGKGAARQKLAAAQVVFVAGGQAFTRLPAAIKRAGDWQPMLKVYLPEHMREDFDGKDDEPVHTWIADDMRSPDEPAASDFSHIWVDELQPATLVRDSKGRKDYGRSILTSCLDDVRNIWDLSLQHGSVEARCRAVARAYEDVALNGVEGGGYLPALGNIKDIGDEAKEAALAEGKSEKDAKAAKKEAEEAAAPAVASRVVAAIAETFESLRPALEAAGDAAALMPTMPGRISLTGVSRTGVTLPELIAARSVLWAFKVDLGNMSTMDAAEIVARSGLIGEINGQVQTLINICNVLVTAMKGAWDAQSFAPADAAAAAAGNDLGLDSGEPGDQNRLIDPLPGIEVHRASAAGEEGRYYLNLAYLPNLAQVYSQVPTVLTDATADIAKLECLWGKGHVGDVGSPIVQDGEGVRRVQLVDSGMSHGILAPRLRDGRPALGVEDFKVQVRNSMRAGVRTAAAAGAAGVITEAGMNVAKGGALTAPMASGEFLRQVFPAIIHHMLIGHWNGNRGSNRFKEARVHSGVGRTTPYVRDAERLAEALFNHPLQRAERQACVLPEG